MIYNFKNDTLFFNRSLFLNYFATFTSSFGVFLNYFQFKNWDYTHRTWTGYAVEENEFSVLLRYRRRRGIKFFRGYFSLKKAVKTQFSASFFTKNTVFKCLNQFLLTNKPTLKRL